MSFVNSGEMLINICMDRNISIAEYTIETECQETGYTKIEILDKMNKNLQVMKESAEYGMYNEVKSISGLIGGDALRLRKYMEKGSSICGETVLLAMARAVSSAEVNASMGKIVASPTAGSCGILPAVIITVAEKWNKTTEDMIEALFAASAVGILIAKNATLSGAEGGCQAECGSAAAMAAAAAVHMRGGTPEECLDAGAIALKNVLGLVCDPIAGLVEAPCAKRNISGAVNAMIAADMVLAGVKSIIPFDDVVMAMYQIGKQLPCQLRETAQGGLAVTPTGEKLRKKIFGIQKTDM